MSFFSHPVVRVVLILATGTALAWFLPELFDDLDISFLGRGGEEESGALSAFGGLIAALLWFLWAGKGRLPSAAELLAKTGVGIGLCFFLALVFEEANFSVKRIGDKQTGFLAGLILFVGYTGRKLVVGLFASIGRAAKRLWNRLPDTPAILVLIGVSTGLCFLFAWLFDETNLEFGPLGQTMSGLITAYAISLVWLCRFLYERRGWGRTTASALVALWLANGILLFIPILVAALGFNFLGYRGRAPSANITGLLVSAAFVLGYLVYSRSLSSAR